MNALEKMIVDTYGPLSAERMDFYAMKSLIRSARSALRDHKDREWAKQWVEKADRTIGSGCGYEGPAEKPPRTGRGSDVLRAAVGRILEWPDFWVCAGVRYLCVYVDAIQMTAEGRSAHTGGEEC